MNIRMTRALLAAVPLLFGTLLLAPEASAGDHYDLRPWQCVGDPNARETYACRRYGFCVYGYLRDEPLIDWCDVPSWECGAYRQQNLCYFPEPGEEEEGFCWVRKTLSSPSRFWQGTFYQKRPCDSPDCAGAPECPAAETEDQCFASPCIVNGEPIADCFAPTFPVACDDPRCNTGPCTAGDRGDQTGTPPPCIGAVHAFVELTAEKELAAPGETVRWSVLTRPRIPVTVDVLSWEPEDEPRPLLEITSDDPGDTTVRGTVTVPSSHPGSVTIRAVTDEEVCEGYDATPERQIRDVTIFTDVTPTTPSPSPPPFPSPPPSPPGGIPPPLPPFGDDVCDCLLPPAVTRLLFPSLLAGGALIAALAPQVPILISALLGGAGAAGAGLGGAGGGGISRLLGLGGAQRRRPEHWVQVVNPLTGRGVGGATIFVRTPDGKTVATWITDPKSGNTGDLLPPGTYAFVVQKEGWTFPAVHEPLFVVPRGELLYRIGWITITETQEIRLHG